MERDIITQHGVQHFGSISGFKKFAFLYQQEHRCTAKSGVSKVGQVKGLLTQSMPPIYARYWNDFGTILVLLNGIGQTPTLEPQRIKITSKRGCQIKRRRGRRTPPPF